METEDSLDELVKQWLNWDRNPVTRGEIQRLHSAGDRDTLRRLLELRLQFGTAGLRARMGAGYSCINELTIIQTSQGLASYLCEQRVSTDSEALGVVIGYDGRHNSRRFAELTAAAMHRRGLRVWLFSDVVPTPWVAFGVRCLGAGAGVMITASHNPRYDNGYKVYWSNGAQILPPHDSNIQTAILANLVPHENAWSTDSCLARAVDPLERVTSEYLAALQKLPAAMAPPDSEGDVEEGGPRLVATAMHGVAHRYLQLAFSTCRLPEYTPVVEQMLPDPDFPTVAFPNPEEGRAALELAFRTAERVQAPVILANDPDADRLAVAERFDQTSSPGFHVFTGNELAALLGWWCCFCYRSQKGPSGPAHIIASTVSSKMLRTMAHASLEEKEEEGGLGIPLRFHETLTGFKWMANLADELERSGETVLFAFEEAIGFMCGTHVLDKDGISAAVCVARMVTHLYLTEKITLRDKLEQLYSRYGYHLTNNSYFICHQPQVVARIFQRLRHWQDQPSLSVEGGQWSYPALIEGAGGQSVSVVSVRDLTTGHDTSRDDGKAHLPTCATSQMLTFTLENGAVLTLRTSGTEPKIKWYAELCGAVGAAPAQLEIQLNELVEAVKLNWLQPQLNQLQARAE